jgi:hypothetical protein
MVGKRKPTPEFHTLRDCAELALYYTLVRADPDLAAEELRDMLAALRNILRDATASSETDRAIGLAYAGARARAGKLPGTAAEYPLRGPRHLQGIVEELSALIDELDTARPLRPSRSREPRMGSDLSTREPIAAHWAGRTPGPSAR